ncbi:hypothetical protein [Amycolatopsis speibonae]|uniref:Uncharacterized protein n=1 Tax=Amycolatopsis speibonae TaxID=1450224 RepID=A0ABV7P9Y8_9PSEU
MPRTQFTGTAKELNDLALAEYSYRPPKWWHRYPRFTAAELAVSHLVLGEKNPLLDDSGEFQAIWKKKSGLKAHRDAISRWRAHGYQYGTMIWIGAAALAFLGTTWPNWLGGLPSRLPAYMLFTCALLAFWARKMRPERRFYRFVTKAEKAANIPLSSAVNTYPVRCMNHSGRAARLLFLHLQGGRRTWAAPPTVADRASEFTYPLINVVLDGAPSSPRAVRSFKRHAEFLKLTACLVALGREDLIPRLRRLTAAHGGIPMRTGDEEAEIPERDLLFLDPMRNHHRWAVVKDFYYPLSSWLSLAVAGVALVISLRR